MKGASEIKRAILAKFDSPVEYSLSWTETTDRCALFFLFNSHPVVDAHCLSMFPFTRVFWLFFYIFFLFTTLWRHSFALEQIKRGTDTSTVSSTTFEIKENRMELFFNEWRPVCVHWMTFFFHFNSFKNDKKTLIGDDVTRELLAIMRPDVEQMPD